METELMRRKTLWSGLIAGVLVLLLGGALVPAHNTQAALFALSDATSCLFQYDVTQQTQEIASR
ncbi:hypothetical protein [Acetobacter persici]|nr:hypothetical protein [Acetobacter persici]